MRPSLRTWVGDFFGAFADTAILLPLLTLLCLKSGFSLSALLISSGALYLASGLLFRLPMPVQPLKSLALSALALGATRDEIQISTLAVGAFFLALFFFGQRLIRLPDALVRTLQWSLGILLVLQGVGGGASGLEIAGIILLAAILWWMDQKTSWPILGIFAFSVFSTSLIPGMDPLPSFASFGIDPPRLSVILALILPQLALTSANSVLGTELTCRDYFPNHEFRGLRSRLLLSIGAGNLIMGLIGGLPFCHGSGGLTAHYRAGARSAGMNAVIGSALLILGWVALAYPRMNWNALPHLPASALLVTVGIYHLGLARQLLLTQAGQRILLTATLVTWITQNLLYALVASACVYSIPHRRPCHE